MLGGDNMSFGKSVISIKTRIETSPKTIYFHTIIL